ncbi:hypothetical protein ACJJTC_001834 [Scirpophaga incertulas]
MDSDRTIVLTANENNVVKTVLDKFDAALNKCERNGPTAKLWTQYFKMVTLVKHFFEEERSGNWELHLDTVQKMLPYFHASGHFLYAKSAHLYLQDMTCLREKMPANEFKKFTDEGYFTIRRTNKFWSGIMSDQTIEQTLNRESKICGGICKRGANDNVAARWTMSSVHMQNICEQIEDFCDIHSGTTEQHVDFRPTRVCRDNSDVEKLDQWFDAHDPFPVDSALMSGVIYTYDFHCSSIGPTCACTVSQCLRHDAAAIWAHLIPMIKLAIEINPFIDTIHFQSDSPSVSTFDQFIDIVKQNIENITIMTINEDEVFAKETLLPKNLKPFQGTLNVHQVLSIVYTKPTLAANKTGSQRWRGICLV